MQPLKEIWYMSWIDDTICSLCNCLLYQLKLSNAHQGQYHIECIAVIQMGGHDPSNPGIKATGAKSKGTLSDSNHLLFQQESWTQEDAQIVHQVHLKQCHPIQDQRWKNFGTRKPKNLQPLQLAWFEPKPIVPIQSPTPPGTETGLHGITQAAQGGRYKLGIISILMISHPKPSDHLTQWPHVDVR